ncbi:MAG TPA: MltA domain-containing protein, partial [Lichenihabitans sp.]|nr:MltA domain-containing protein [Lichenihabitans sp.]
MSAAALAFSGARLDPPFRLTETDFDSLVGFREDDLAASWRTLQRSTQAIARGLAPLRAAVAPEAWTRVARRLATIAEPANAGAARALFRACFTPYRIEPADPATRGFLTGYYEPVIPGSLMRTPDFTAPVLARPKDYARLGPGVAADPYPERAAIEAAAERGEGRAVAWLSDWAEVSLVQVQGSARVVLPDGSEFRLVY